ncbi:MAG: hypothetical protein WCD52_03230, partial [Xanthobacteraceae bacterium]
AIVDSGGERTMALARSSANTSPQGRRALENLSDPRFEQQAHRISGVVRNLTGGSHATLDNAALKSAARKANAPAYKRAYQISERRNPNGIISPKLEELMSSDALPTAMQRAVPLGKDRSVVEGMGPFTPRVTFQNGALKVDRTGGAPVAPDLRFWDYTQRALHDMAEQAKRSGAGGAGDAISSLHRELLEELDERAPEFAFARGQAAAFFKAGDALEAGQYFVMQNADIEEARMALSKMNAAERELFARGFASELADKIFQMRDRRNVLRSAFLDSPAARKKIMLALGPQRARELEVELRAEDIVDRLRQALLGSTTTRQLAEAGMAGGALATFEGLKEHSFNPAHILAAAVTVGLARHGAKIIDEKVARRVGEMLAANDPAVLAKGLKVVASRPALMNALRHASDVTTRQLINYLRPSGVAAAATLDDELFSLPSKHSENLPGGDGNYYQDDQGGNGPH